ncbi:MAG: hypothetical protein HY823_02110, partial [Acidobacteria bacterium]|nr:hypothetical protein [Acidobacteriota bacterium]
MTSQYRSLLSLLTVCLAGGSLMAAAPDREDVERRVKPSAASFRREMTKELS